jgi:large subunit ribosomal protein L10
VDRAAKTALIATLNTALKDTGTIVVAHNKGLVAAQSADLRRKVKAAGGTVKVAKNKLTALALKGTKAEGITPLLKGPVILAFSKDPVAAAKAMSDYAKGNDKLELLGGVMDTTVLNAAGVQALANLPSLDELRAKRPSQRAGDEDRPHGQGARCPAGPRHPGQGRTSLTPDPKHTRSNL